MPFVPDHVKVEPIENAPVAVEDGENRHGVPDTVNREQFPALLGWDTDRAWLYYGNPATGSVASIPAREGCRSSRWGDRFYLRSALYSWGRGRFVLTPEGCAFIGLQEVE
jgi:hypothetical protein